MEDKLSVSLFSSVASPFQFFIFLDISSVAPDMSDHSLILNKDFRCHDPYAHYIAFPRRGARHFKRPTSFACNDWSLPSLVLVLGPAPS